MHLGKTAMGTLWRRLRLESVQPSRAERKVVFAKAETAGVRREAAENFLQAEGTRTISYLGVVLDGF